VPDCAIAGHGEGMGRKFLVGRFQHLQADNVGLCRTQPPQQVGQAAVDIVDVDRCDFHVQSGEARPKSTGGRIIACLNKQRAQISEACRKVVDAQKK
jgi:hypothetical protein